MLENRVSRLYGQLQRLQQLASTQGCSLDTSHLNVLYEDLHWIVLVTSKYCNGIQTVFVNRVCKYAVHVYYKIASFATTSFCV